MGIQSIGGWILCNGRTSADNMYSAYTHTKELKGMFDNERFIKT